MAAVASLRESLWLDQPKYESAESAFYSILANRHLLLKVEGKAVVNNPISSEIEKAMNLIGNSLRSNTQTSAGSCDLENRVSELERANLQIKSTLADVLKRLSAVEGKSSQKPDNVQSADDDFDLFGSDDEGGVSQVQEQLQINVVQKKKPQVIAKSSIVLDIKPWDDETDLSAMESSVRSITADGLKWGASKILPVAYGIKKLQISCVVEDDKIGTDFLEESITAFEDLVQSVDIVAFNKI